MAVFRFQRATLLEAESDEGVGAEWRTLVAIVVGGGCLVVEPALGKKMKIIFSQCLTRVRCTPIIVSSLRRGARVAKGGRL